MTRNPFAPFASLSRLLAFALLTSAPLSAQTTFSTDTTLLTDSLFYNNITIAPGVTVTGSSGVTATIVPGGFAALIDGTLVLPTGFTLNATRPDAITEIRVGSSGQISMQGGVFVGSRFILFGSNTIVANGGTLRASVDDGGFLWQLGGDTPAVYLAAGGLTIDTNGHDISTLPSFTGVGGFTKSGAGVLRFIGIAEYTGATTIEAGTFVLAKAHGLRRSSNVHIAAGAKLDASAIGGYIGGFDVTDKATFAGLSGEGSISLGTTNFRIGYADASSTFAGGIAGSGSLTKIGTGTFTIAGENNYTGGSSIEDGTTVIATGGSISHPSASIIIGRLGGSATVEITGGALTTGVGGIGYFGGFIGTVNLSAGSWTSSSLEIGWLGNGTLNLSGGTASTGATHLGKIGGRGTLNLSGGVLETSGLFRYSVLGNLTASGGTLRATANNANYLDGFSTGGITLNSGGLIIDTNTFNVGISAALAGTGGLTQTGSGTLTLSGAPTYTGATTVNGGTLLLGAANLLPTTNAFIVNDSGTLDSGNHSLTVGSLAGTGSGTLALGSGSLTAGGADASTSFAGAITGTGNLTKTGSGNFTLAGANTYTGTTAINAGTLTVATAGSITTPAATVAVGTASTGTLAISGGTVTADKVTLGFNVGVGTLSLSNSGILTTTTLERWSGGSTVTFDGATLRAAGDAPQLINGFTVTSAVLNSGGLTIDTNGHDAGFSANTVLFGPGGLTKTGAGTLTLATTQAYEGATTINAGTLLLASSTALPSGTAVTVASGATLSSADQALSLAALSGQGTVNTGTSAFTVGSGNVSTTFAGALSTSGGLTKTGTGTFTLSGANTYTGDTSVTGGTLELATGGSIQHAAHSVVIANIGTANVTLAGGDLTASSVILGHDGGTATLTLNAGTLTTSEIARWSVPSSVIFNGGTLRAASNTNVLINGFTAGSAVINSGGLTLDSNNFTVVIGAELSGTGSLTKTGAGSLSLNGANTYSGATVVSAGTLALGASGSLASSAVLRVASGATLDVSAVTGGFSLGSGQTLAGSGTVAGSLALASGATLAPGNSPGTLTTGSETWSGGATYVWEINDATSPQGAGAAGTNYDLVAISGTLTLAATSENKFTLSLVSLLANNTAGDVVNFNSAANSAYTIATTAGGILGFDASAFTINTTGFTNALNGGTWSLALANSNRDLALQFTAATAAAIPEPSTYAALAGAAALALAAWRRRR